MVWAHLAVGAQDVSLHKPFPGDCRRVFRLLRAFHWVFPAELTQRHGSSELVPGKWSQPRQGAMGRLGLPFRGRLQLCGGVQASLVHPLPSKVEGQWGTAAKKPVCARLGYNICASGFLWKWEPGLFWGQAGQRLGKDRVPCDTEARARCPGASLISKIPHLLKSSAPGVERAPLPRTPAHPRAVNSLHKVASTPKISRGKA